MTNLKAPTPVGPYSMFRELSSGGWISSGQIPIDPLISGNVDPFP